MSESDGLNGQWFGTYSGSSNGTIIVNIDKSESGFQGVAYLTDEDQTLPVSVVGFALAGGAKEFSVRTDWIIFFDRVSGQGIGFGLAPIRWQGREATQAQREACFAFQSTPRLLPNS